MLVEHSIVAAMAKMLVNRVGGEAHDAGIGHFVIDGFAIRVGHKFVEIAHRDFHVVMQGNDIKYHRGSYLGMMLVAFESETIKMPEVRNG